MGLGGPACAGQRGGSRRANRQTSTGLRGVAGEYDGGESQSSSGRASGSEAWELWIWFHRSILRERLTEITAI